MARDYYRDTVSGNLIAKTVKVEDTLPVGTEVDYDGQDIPEGWVEVDDTNEYSTTETVVGTWLDGKPIYRKVFTGTFSNDANTYNIGTITNIGNVIKNYGRTIVGGTTSYYTPLNIYLDSNFRSLVQIATTTGQIVATYGDTFKGRAFEYIVEYTKTTD